jgi:CRISPR-associated endonuclease Csn1
MKKILGLDLGTTSIGWAFVHLNEADATQSKVYTGVRITPLTTDEKNEFNSGQAISTTAQRTQKRGARKNLDRYQLRRERLLKITNREGWLDAGESYQLIETDHIWSIRSKAASEQITLEDFAKVLFHLNKKRGFKSNRKANTEEDSNTEFKTAIKESDRAVKELGYTIGQWVNELLHERDSISQRVYRDITWSRSLNEEEFDQIWETQSKFYPQLTPSLKKEIGDYTIFYQRRLKSQKGKLSNCQFYDSPDPKGVRKKVVPASSPLFELFRVWHDINNLDVKLAENRQTLDLPIEFKKFLAKVFTNLKTMHEVFGTKSKPTPLKKKITATDIKKLVIKEFGGKTSDYLVNLEVLIPAITWLEIQEAALFTGYERFDLTAFDYLVDGKAYNDQPLMQLWHVLYSTEEVEDLVKVLREKFSMTQEQITAFEKVHLKDDYGSLSSKAIKQILPHLHEGHMYSEACALAGFRHSSFETKKESEERVLLDKLSHLKRGKLRNPVVEKIMNQLVNVVNCIIASDEMGRPDEIHIEMGRELTATAQQRSKISKAMSSSRKARELIREKLQSEFGIKKVSRNDILKYRLGEETNWISLYTGRPIEKYKVFQTGEYDIEHIIPKSRLFDDSFSNKTLCEAEVNRAKGNMTAFDYMESLGDEHLQGYIERVKFYSVKGGTKQISYGKELKLFMKREDIPDDFISRQLNESRYIAREALKLLQPLISTPIVTTGGTLTSYLRKQWGLEDIIKEINLPKYKELGLVSRAKNKGGQEFDVIEDWAKRDDHRHHAVDALTVALTNRSAVQRIDKLNQFMGDYNVCHDSEEFKSGLRVIECPIPNIRALAKPSFEELLVSHKPGKKVATWSKSTHRVKGGKATRRILIPRGQLHQETVYGKNKIKSNPIELAKVTNPELIIDQDTRLAFQLRLNKSGLTIKKAFGKPALRKEPFTVNGKIIDKVQCWEEYYTIRAEVNENLDVSKVVDEQIKYMLFRRLEEFENSKKKAFTNLDENPIWFDQSKGIAIKKVKIKARPNTLVALRTSEETGNPKDFISPSNNHHIAIYRLPDGKLTSRMVTFMEAVERKQQNLPVVNRDEPGLAYITHFTVNELFSFNEKIPTSKAELSRDLWRVQKLSSQGDGRIDIFFRHHLETNIQREMQYSFRRITSFKNLPRFKHRINVVGKIVDSFKIDL